MKFTLDNRVVETKENNTILQAAEALDIYIPHICSHRELTPYGGCRLCIVEVEGMRGYPTACTTLAAEGMIVRTHTRALRETRLEILQMILSEHPSGCLVCAEAKECLDFQQTIRKVGLTTGCRWCPKDEDCELQKVVRSLQIEEITFPGCYRELPVENSDPFFDRDYNLCIYCGRCVRICQELRKSSVITLKKRGRATTIGPAFEQTHLEANCEFCGACISVCPTGAMAEKSRKWHGVASEYQQSLCPLCSMNCAIQIAVKDGRIIGTLPPGDPHQSGGELCVKGRFCLSEWVNHPRRHGEPRYHFPEGMGIVSWEKAIEKASEIMQATPPGRTGVFLSADLTLEEIAAAKQFFLQARSAPRFFSSALNQKMIPFMALAQKSIAVKEIEDSDLIISLFLNGNHGYAPLTLAVKRASEKGIPYLQVGWIKDTTSRFASLCQLPPPGQEKEFFADIERHLRNGKGKFREAKKIAAYLKTASAPVVILGADICSLDSSEPIMRSIENIVTLSSARLLTVHPHGNLSGLLSMLEIKTSEEAARLIAGGEIDSLYLVCDNPFETRPAVKSIIFQDVFPPAYSVPGDLILPTTTFGESPGSYYTGRGDRERFSNHVSPPETVRHQHWIFSRIAAAMGVTGVRFDEKELSSRIPDQAKSRLPDHDVRHRTARGKFFPPGKKAAFILIQVKSPHLYHHTSLSQIVPGMKAIAPEDTILINPDDAGKVPFVAGHSVEVKSAQRAKIFPLQTRKIIPPGIAYLHSSSENLFFEANPLPVSIVAVGKRKRQGSLKGRKHV
jgi:formate dehydrogenase major subunit